MNSSVFNLRTQGTRGVSEWHTGRGPTRRRVHDRAPWVRSLDWLREEPTTELAADGAKTHRQRAVLADASSQSK